MPIQCGIVGLPNVGKSTLFNALTRAQIAAENYPFCTIDPNVGVVPVPDGRLEQLAQIAHPEKILPTTVEFVDIAGLVRGASQGEGLGNQFLAHIRDCDAIALVARCFEDTDVGPVAGGAERQARVVKTGDDEVRTWRMLQLLTAKPALYVCNVDEVSAAGGNALSDAVVQRAAQDKAKAVVISAKIESELAGLDPEERA